ncbi:hypothetical protein CCY99_01510 [Helicobacter sp. 16-1353]|uniref:MBL fold metallo-hydrolase n=1 Tax=Helicobacter sp. 16-1353 TaxID=2004996 RepID=UPI000DCD2E5C|nr:MBL fold metallo-hydrolase [Helicobacter sp. 16-1353]RAX54857.1 hypothetical protein CCY99_01510 [Helicobacter sp. 16-1353]
MKKITILLICFIFAIIALVGVSEIFIKGKNMNEERIINSPHFKNGRFHNIEPVATTFENEGKKKDSMLKIMLDIFITGEKPKNIPAIKSDLKSLGKKDYVVWFGHSSYLLQVGGKRILVDPVFGRASPVPFINNPFSGTDIYHAEDLPNIDYLVITHNHYDHLSKNDIKALKSKVKTAIAPLGVGKYLRNWGIENIIELDWNEEYVESGADKNDKISGISGKITKSTANETDKPNKSSDFKIFCLTAKHFSGRKIFDSNATLWASFLVEIMGRKIYIGGDSGYGGHFREIGERFGKIDLAFLENGQYNENWREIHMFPQDVLNAANDLNATSLFPVHNSKFRISLHSWNEPLSEISKLHNSKKYEKIELLMPQIGEIVPLWEKYNYKKWWEGELNI